MSVKPWSLGSLLRLRCPACGADSFRRGLFRTAKTCASCGQLFDRGSGFYAGAIYPMYGATAVLGGLFFLGGLLAGLSFSACLYLAGLAALLASPWLFWYARLAFLYTDHRFFGENS